MCANFFCIVMLEPWSTCVWFFFFLIYILIADNISILLYIMCVILRLFSALSHRVGALQISVIIIIINISHCVYFITESLWHRSPLLRAIQIQRTLSSSLWANWQGPGPRNWHFFFCCTKRHTTKLRLRGMTLGRLRSSRKIPTIRNTCTDPGM